MVKCDSRSGKRPEHIYDDRCAFRFFGVSFQAAELNFHVVVRSVGMISLPNNPLVECDFLIASPRLRRGLLGVEHTMLSGPNGRVKLLDAVLYYKQVYFLVSFCRERISFGGFG